MIVAKLNSDLKQKVKNCGLTSGVETWEFVNTVFHSKLSDLVADYMKQVEALPTISSIADPKTLIEVASRKMKIHEDANKIIDLHNQDLSPDQRIPLFDMRQVSFQLFNAFRQSSIFAVSTWAQIEQPKERNCVYDGRTAIEKLAIHLDVKAFKTRKG
jgi:hypothetical protein